MVTGSGSTAIHQLFSYDASGNVVSVDYSSDGGSTFATYYYVRNAQNDVVKLINGSGTTVVEYTYDTWGKLLATTGSLASTLGANQPFRYRGYVYDTETGWYYLQSRYYDPSIGRFISADVFLSTGQGVLGHNAFAYCGNNPVIRIDDEGEFWHIVIGAALGGLFELGSQLISNGGDFSEVEWKKVGVATLSGGLTAAAGPLAGAAISGVANVAMDVIDGERSIEKLAVSFGVGAGTSLIGSGVSKVVEKVGGNIAIKQLSKLSKRKIKMKIGSIYENIKGSEVNAIKNIDYLMSDNRFKDLGSKLLGKSIPTLISGVFEGGIGLFE